MNKSNDGINPTGGYYMNTNEVDTRDIAEISTDISEWVVAQQKRRTPEFLRIGMLASEGELVEIPSYDNLYGVARRLDLKVRPDQAYKLAQMIIEAVEGGLGEMESDRVQLHIEMPERLQHEVVPSVAQCTPSRGHMVTEGMRAAYNRAMNNAAPMFSGGLDE